MKRSIAFNLSLFLLVLTIFSFNGSAQEMPEDIVNWSFSVEQSGEEATVLCKVSIVDHWHINATKLPEGTFGFATIFDLTPSSNFKKIGGVIEPTPIEKYDDLADEQLSYHEGVFYLKQKIKVLSEKDFELKGLFHFQTCNDVKCLRDMPVDFSVKIKGVKTDLIENAEVEENADQQEGDKIDEKDQLSTDSLSTPEEIDSSEINKKKKTVVKDLKNGSKNDSEDDDSSLWGIFWLAFGSGFIALLTPCVFPMIPMTVSFFTKQSKTKPEGIRNAIIYGLSIIGIYVLFGLLVVASGSASILNEMSTNPWFNLGFFVLLVVFAVSFMGAFEIRMPNSWINKADRRADKGGLLYGFSFSSCLILLHWPNIRSSSGWYGKRWRRRSIAYGDVRLWISPCNAFCFVCSISRLDEYHAFLRRLVKHGESCFGIFRTCSCFQISLECRFGLASSYVGKRGLFSNMDCNIWSAYSLSLR